MTTGPIFRSPGTPPPARAEALWTGAAGPEVVCGKPRDRPESGTQAVAAK